MGEEEKKEVFRDLSTKESSSSNLWQREVFLVNLLLCCLLLSIERFYPENGMREALAKNDLLDKLIEERKSLIVVTHSTKL